jgi:hypothetical protein
MRLAFALITSANRSTASHAFLPWYKKIVWKCMIRGMYVVLNKGHIGNPRAIKDTAPAEHTGYND